MPCKMALLLEISTVFVCLASAYVAVGQDVNPANGIVTTPQQTKSRTPIVTPISTRQTFTHLERGVENTTPSAKLTSVQTSVTDTTSSVVAKSTDTTSSVVAKSTDTTSSVVAKSTDTTSSVVAKSTDTTSSVVGKSTDTTSSVVGKSTDTTSSVVGKSRKTTSSVVGKSRKTTSSVVGKSRDTISSVVGKSRKTTPSVVEKSVTTFQIASAETSPVTTTKIQTAPFLCYDCNSGNHLKGGVKNSLCSEDGTIAAAIYTPTSCKKPCFSRVDRYPAGSVYRGCSESLYLPGGIPDTDSCFEDPATRNHLCFCSEDRCNTHNLSQLSMAYVEQHYTQTTQKTV